MTNLKKHLSIGFTMIVALTMLMGSVMMAQGGNLKFEVSITNTSKQILSPAVVASHNAAMSPIFTVGEPASSELAAVAEDAMLDPLMSALSASPNVIEVATITGVNGPILPGETASVVLDAGNGFHSNRISLVGMLVTTNDAFYGLDAVTATLLPPYLTTERIKTFYSPAYDAGSEFNNEDCDYIPGPPCGNGGVRDTTDAEGFVHTHPGIHGTADLVPAEHDWRNPVAKITVRLFRQR
jgi:hypothetical protein